MVGMSVNSSVPATSAHVVGDSDADLRKKGKYKIKKGDTLYSLAKNFNVSVSDFKKKAGLKGDTLNVDQIISVPSVQIPQGSGLLALSRENHMDYNDFLKLNNIGKNYKPKPGEYFYIAPNNENSTSTPASSPKSKPVSSASPSSPVKPPKAKLTAAQNTTTGTNTGTYTVPKCGYISIGKDDTHNVRCIKEARPPKPLDSKGNVVAEVYRYEPLKNNTGELKDKVIMVNAGHGWKKTDIFDRGTAYDDLNGKTLEEWRKNRDFAEDLINKLRAKGATVIFTAGGDITVCPAKKQYKCDMLISLHCNAVNKKNVNGLQAYYPDGKEVSIDLAKVLGKKLSINEKNIKSDITTRHKRIGILRASSKGKTVPSVLLEMGYMSNAADLANIDSWKVRGVHMEAVANGIVEYYKGKK